MTTKRKPYVRPMPATWWTKLGFYTFYIVRESTALFALWFSAVLIYGIFAMQNGLQGQAEFIDFLKNPVVLVLNIIALLAALLHTKTWFDLAPKAVNVVVGDAKLGTRPIIATLWVVTIAVTAIALALVLA